MKITMGERIPTEVTVDAIGNLLNRFADQKHPALKEERFAKYLVPHTGVTAKLGWSDNPNLILFTWFVTGRKGQDDEVDLIISVEFDQRDFHNEPMTYIANMIRDTAERIEKATRPKVQREGLNEAGGSNVIQLPV